MSGLERIGGPTAADVVDVVRSEFIVETNLKAARYGRILSRAARHRNRREVAMRAVQLALCQRAIAATLAGMASGETEP